MTLSKERDIIYHSGDSVPGFLGHCAEFYRFGLHLQTLQIQPLLFSPPSDSIKFTIHLNTSGHTHQLFITRNIKSGTFTKKPVRVYFKKLEKQTLFMSIQPSFSVLELPSFSHASETCTHTRQFDLVHRCVGFLVLAVSLPLYSLYKTVASQGD